MFGLEAEKNYLSWNRAIVSLNEAWIDASCESGRAEGQKHSNNVTYIDDKQMMDETGRRRKLVLNDCAYRFCFSSFHLQLKFISAKSTYLKEAGDPPLWYGKINVDRQFFNEEMKDEDGQSNGGHCWTRVTDKQQMPAYPF
ncbi:unnamed protein product [Acanthocheilonema viteae]|uniref:Uncharacterized protein n=1 Tax=Acanthocheilonema viteae TaxID=6277 RepID=A0A498S4W2_ACAVI|nr:unnamed protein product [Acanthocheilonema viteae]